MKRIHVMLTQTSKRSPGILNADMMQQQETIDRMSEGGHISAEESSSQDLCSRENNLKDSNMQIACHFTRIKNAYMKQFTRSDVADILQQKKTVQTISCRHISAERNDPHDFTLLTYCSRRQQFPEIILLTYRSRGKQFTRFHVAKMMQQKETIHTISKWKLQNNPLGFNAHTKQHVKEPSASVAADRKYMQRDNAACEDAKRPAAVVVAVPYIHESDATIEHMK